MGVRDILKEIEELRSLVNGGESQREEALNQVKRLYEMIRFPTEDVEEEVVAEEVIEEEVVAEEEVIEEKENAIEEVIEEEEIEVVEEEVDDEAERKRARRREILSLYEESTEQSSQTPIATPAPEVVTQEQPKEVVSSQLLDSLSFNDRLLLSTELFEGDFSKMESLIIALEGQPSLDDALIYIAQRYRWGGENEGAKLLYKLLQNRYLQQ